MLDKLIQNSGEIHSWIFGNLDDLEIKRKQPELLSVACFDMVLEYQQGITHLVESKVYGPAFSMVRSIFESLVRGLWFQHCATDKEIARFIKEDKLKKLSVLIGAIEKVPGFEEGVISGVRGTSWPSMCSYTHSGILQLSRRISDGDFFPNYSDDEIKEVLKFSNMMALFAVR